MSLRVSLKGTGEPVFTSQGRWLHPLFDLGDHLAVHPEVLPGSLVLRDRVIGRGAAFLIVRLGIRTAAADVVSRRAVPVFEAHGVTWSAGELVDQIGCRTEDLLAEIFDPEEAWVVLDGRRRLSMGGASGS